ncbi:MAG: HEAT repeat domain-containing protein [Acidobacteria bacterium]|nr:HEAT repeat domain-containing protein [Acidobacteriota bacterium]MCA1639699.1 HEAT repeat domain-containing protein [Acidobacteriota bacterium]
MNTKLLQMKFFPFLPVFLLMLAFFSPGFSQAQNALPTQKKLPPVNYVRSRDVDIKNVSIDLHFDWDKEQAFGATVVTLAPFKDLNKFSLDAASMMINSVTLASGSQLKFNYDAKKENDNLEITLDRAYKRGEDIAVKIDYRTSYVNTADADTAIGSFGRGLRFIKPTADNPNKPRQIWSQGETEFNRYWFPSYDSPNDFRTSELRATVQKPFTVVSNGKLVEVKDNGDNTRTFYWKMDMPYTNYLTSIVVGEYAEVKQDYAGIPIINYAYPNETKEVAATVKNLPDMLRFFSEKTGVKYPYPKYAQTFVEDFGGGMENISATTMIEEMVHDERELIDQDSDSLQAHELAHQWFGDYVTTREWSDIWLNESFATYFDALYNEHSKGRDDFLFNNIRANQNSYFNAWNQGNRRPIVTKHYANKDAMFDAYAYPRGGAVLHMLRKHLGEENWWKAINHYLVSNANQPVSTEEFRIAIEEATGESMDWFFDQWLYRMGHPIFEVTKNYDTAKKQLTLNVKQTQKIDPTNEFPQVEFFRSFVDVEIGTPTATRVERVWIKPKAENVFTFAVDANPTLVNFDYERTLIKELKFDKSVDELIYQMTNDKDVLGRSWAMGELAKPFTSETTSAADKAKIFNAMTGAITKEPFWGLRRDIISRIPPGNDKGNPLEAMFGDNKTPAPKFPVELVNALMTAAKDPNSNVRAAAISMLGRTKDARFVDLYVSALNDRSYGVIDAASASLAMTKDARSYDQLVKLVGTPSWKDRIKIAGLSGLAVLEDKRSLEMGLKFAADKMQSGNVRSTALIIVASSGKGDPRAFPLIFESYKKALENNQFQSIFNALASFIRLADPRGQEAFDLAKAKFKSQPQLLGYVAMFEAQFKKAIADTGNRGK